MKKVWIPAGLCACSVWSDLEAAVKTTVNKVDHVDSIEPIVQNLIDLSD